MNESRGSGAGKQVSTQLRMRPLWLALALGFTLGAGALGIQVLAGSSFASAPFGRVKTWGNGDSDLRKASALNLSSENRAPEHPVARSLLALTADPRPASGKLYFPNSPVPELEIPEKVAQNVIPAALPPVSSEYQTYVDRFLDRLQSQGFTPQGQGVMFVSLDGFELAGHQPTQSLPAASVTKLATSLAALEIWGPEHRFTTRIYTVGEVRDRVLHGDLIVVGDGDPYFVWEDSFALGSEINRLGIRHVTGDFRVLNSFYMNYSTNQTRSAELLRWGMHQSLWPQAARSQYVKWALLHPLAPTPNLSFSGKIETGGVLPESASLLLEHHSPPLTDILKALNSFSNNAMADMLASRIGGISKLVDAVVPFVPQGEMQVVTASGLGRGNQFSPRAVVGILAALDRIARQEGLKLEDWLPVVGQDPGTLRRRTAPTGTAAKSGTLNSVATLAGILPDRTYFVLLNQGWDLASIRSQQDRLLREVLQVSVDLDSPQVDASN